MGVQGFTGHLAQHGHGTSYHSWVTKEWEEWAGRHQEEEPLTQHWGRKWHVHGPPSHGPALVSPNQPPAGPSHSSPPAATVGWTLTDWLWSPSLPMLNPGGSLLPSGDVAVWVRHGPLSEAPQVQILFCLLVEQILSSSVEWRSWWHPPRPLFWGRNEWTPPWKSPHVQRTMKVPAFRVSFRLLMMDTGPAWADLLPRPSPPPSLNSSPQSVLLPHHPGFPLGNPCRQIPTSGPLHLLFPGLACTFPLLLF